MDLPTARQILKEYSCLQPKIPETAAEQERLRQALLFVTQRSDWENFGICASTSAEAIAALKSYLPALGHSLSADLSAFPTSDRPVYLKYNTQRASAFLDDYTGDYRGVLVACQAEDETIAGTYGYFPLDLFGKDAMEANPR